MAVNANNVSICNIIECVSNNIQNSNYGLPQEDFSKDIVNYFINSTCNTDIVCKGNSNNIVTSQCEPVIISEIQPECKPIIITEI